MNSRSPLARRETPAAWLFLAPSLAGIAVFLVLPILVVIWLSLNRWDLLSPMRFVGLANWSDIITEPTFGHSMLVTVTFVLMVIPLQTALGLLLAAITLFVVALAARRRTPSTRKSVSAPTSDTSSRSSAHA